MNLSSEDTERVVVSEVTLVADSPATTTHTDRSDAATLKCNKRMYSYTYSNITIHKTHTRKGSNPTVKYSSYFSFLFMLVTFTIIKMWNSTIDTEANEFV